MLEEITKEMVNNVFSKADPSYCSLLAERQPSQILVHSNSISMLNLKVIIGSSILLANISEPCIS